VYERLYRIYDRLVFLIFSSSLFLHHLFLARITLTSITATFSFNYHIHFILLVGAFAQRGWYVNGVLSGANVSVLAWFVKTFIKILH
jgi:hypothetical protein